jgi:hypothetical protein
MASKKEPIKLRGFFRMQIGERDEAGNLRIVGDSGMCENTMTNVGIDKGVVTVLAASAGSQLAQSISLGTQTNAINATQTGLSGPATVAGAWATVDKATVQTGTFRMTCTLAGSVYGSDIGAICVASATNGAILSGETFAATSSFDTGQTASVTYEWQVS